MSNDVLFDFAISRNPVIENPSEYVLADKDWEDFISFVESEFTETERDEPYQAVSQSLTNVLEKALEEDGLLESNQEILSSLKNSIAPNIRKDLLRNEEEIRKALEEEIVFQKANTTGLFEYQLPRDPNAIKAIELLESGEYKNILLGQSE